MSEHQFTPLGPDAIFKVLGNPLRLILFEYLSHQELAIEDMESITGKSYQTLYTQLVILEKNNLVESYLDGKYRYYLATDSALQELSTWTERYTEIIKTRKI